MIGSDTAKAQPSRSPWHEFMATAWPPTEAADSASRRRRKSAVRTGHAAMALLIVAAVGSAIVTSPGDYSSGQIVGLCVASLAYITWNLVGTRGVVSLVLWDDRDPPSINALAPRCGVGLYFLLQIALAATVYLVADRGRIPNLVWLALLPPVAYAVFLMEWRGIATVSALVAALLVGSFYYWHGALFAAYSALAFSFAVLFTIVFTLLAVHSEKSRNEVQRLASELSTANNRLREYAVQAEELAVSRERNRIAREIHDSLGHYLTVVNVQIEAARALESTDPGRAREALAKAQSFTQEGLRDIRQSLAALRASPLENKTLVNALRGLVTDSNSAGTAAEFRPLGQPRQLSSPAELCLYRAAQEGLTNTRKHARAKRVQLFVDFETSGRVRLSVKDDGVGAVADAATGGFGLLGLRERAQLVGGELRIETQPNAGFALTLEVPG